MTHAISTVGLTKTEWLRERKRGIGASEVGVALGLSPYKSPRELYLEKVAEEVIETPENDAMHFGLKLEDTVASEFMEREGLTVRRDNKIRIHPEHPFLFCNLDRTIVATNGEGPGVLEIKTASSFAAEKWETEIPIPYFCQIQAQFACTQYTWGWFAILIDGREYRSIPVKRDDSFIDQQTAALVAWWNEHVIAGVPPEPTVADLEGIQTEPGAVIEASVDVIDVYRQLGEVKAELAKHKTQKEELEERIKLYMGAKEVLALNGEALCTWKRSKDSLSFDSKKFRKENPAMAAKYESTKPGSRRFLMKGGKDDE
jgi:putative phage-type endonuclease